MGMYDFIDIDESINLPDYPPNMSRSDFQTKTFPDPLMTIYKITNEGKLLQEQWHYEDVPEEERPCYPFKNDWESVIGMVKKITDGWKELDFHGWLTFYTSVNKEWFEYEAKFTDGNLVKIKRKENIPESVLSCPS
jgi:hypothetical protein